MSVLGVAATIAQLALSSISIHPNKRGLFYQDDLSDIIETTGIVIEEHHSDNLEITQHPIEQGAAITDHAYKRPAELTLKLGWSNSPILDKNTIRAEQLAGAAATLSPVAGAIVGAVGVGIAAASLLFGDDSSSIKSVYAQLLKLQTDRTLFTIYTGKRVYVDMICKSLTTESDSESENSLIIAMSCQQVILVNTNLVSLPKGTQKNPAQTASPTSKGQVSANG